MRRLERVFDLTGLGVSLDYVGDGGFSGGGDGSVQVREKAKYSLISVDVDGVDGSDFRIRVQNVFGLDEDHFIL